MKILLVTNNLYPEIGGPYTVITTIVRELLMKNIKIKVYPCFDGKKKSTKSIYDLIKKQDIIHYYGGWSLNHIVVFLICFFLKKKFIFTPMGIFDGWSLEQKKIKKKIALTLYQKKILDNCDIIHATSYLEKKNIRKLTNNKNIIVIPHGINKLHEKSVKKKFFINNKKRALFFSRLHKKKGIEELLLAWKRSDLIDWELHVYGPDFSNFLDELDPSLKNIENVIFKGEIFDTEKKNKIFVESDLFILPSKSENFGYVILESLRAGVPVMTTTKTPWKDIQDTNSGWIVNDNINDIEKTLKEINLINQDQFLIKSKNSIKLSENYLWEVILDKYISLYEDNFK
jgi:glycosyltransferase involved in cell wall biosynthesis